MKPIYVADPRQYPLPDVLNYETQMLPYLRLWEPYKKGTLDILQNWPANLYGVLNFNLPGIEPNSCREKINKFDMKLSRLLYGQHWSQTHPSVRYQFLAVPEHATFLHYNVYFNVPADQHKNFWFDAPYIWEQIVPSGALNLQPIGDTSKDFKNVREYALKAFHPDWTLEKMITSMEFRRKRK